MIPYEDQVKKYSIVFIENPKPCCFGFYFLLAIFSFRLFIYALITVLD